MKWITIENKPQKMLPVLLTIEYAPQLRRVHIGKLWKDNTWHYADTGERIHSECKIIAWTSIPDPYTGDME